MTAVCLSDLSVSVRLSWETADERWCCDSYFQSSKTDHPPLGSQLRAIDQSQMSTDLSRPSMTHDTGDRTRVHIIQFIRQCLSFCPNAPGSGHSPPTVLSPSLNPRLFDGNIIAIESGEMMGEREQGGIRIFQLDFRRLGSVRTLSH